MGSTTDTAEGPLLGRQADEHDGALDDKQLLPELVAHLRRHRSQLRQEWAGRITDGHLLTAMTPQEIHSETTSVYDNYVEVLETGSVEALRQYARDLSERIIPQGRRDPRGARHRPAAARRAGAFAVPEVLADLTVLDHVLDAVRAGGQPHRQHRGRQLRRRARAGHPAAAGRHP
jgi:hypothetical protein